MYIRIFDHQFRFPERSLIEYLHVSQWRQYMELRDGHFDQAIEAGADTLVMGRAVWSAKNPAEKIRELLQQIN